GVNMAGKGTIGAKFVLEGEKEYRQALKDIAAEQKVLRSEMKLAAEIHKEDADSLESLTEQYEILTKQIDAQERKIKVYSDAISDLEKKRQKEKEKAEELVEVLDKEENKLQQLTEQYGKNSEEAEQQAKAVEEIKNKLLLAQEAYDKAGRKTLEWQATLNGAQTELVKLKGNLSETEKGIEAASVQMDQAEDAVENLGEELDNTADKSSVFGEVLKANLASEVIIDGVKKIAEGIGEISHAAIEYGRDFEASMSQVAATMGMTQQEIENGSRSYELLKTSAIECGKATKFSSSEAAEALNYLALAGYDAEKAAETLPKVLNLAAAGGLELAYASDLVTDSMAALGMETEELDSYIDQMAKTSQKSNTSVAQLGEASLVCAGTVALTGQSIETMNTELGILANNGIKGAEGGTHLRNVLLSLSAPTDKAERALNRLGVQVADSSGNMRDLNNIMIDLDRALSNMSTVEKTQTINTIFNKTDIAAVNALLKGTGEEFDNLKQQIIESNGAASEMANTMSANLKGKLDQLSSGLEALGIAAYDKINGTLKNSVDAATESVGRLQNSMDSGELGEAMDGFAESLESAAEGAIDFAEDALPVLIDGLSWILDNSDLVIAGLSGIAAGHVYMGTVAPVIQTVTTSWKAYKAANDGATASQWLLNTAMSANPAGMIVTGIVALTAAVATLAVVNADNNKEFERSIDTYQQSRKVLEDNREARRVSSEQLKSEAEVIGKLKNEILDLNSKERLSTEEKMKLSAAVDQLNQAMPELNLIIDEQTGKLEENNEAIEDLIESQLEEMKLIAAQEDLQATVNDLYEAEKKLVELQEQQAIKQGELAEKTEEYNRVLENSEAALADATAAYAATAEIDQYKIMIGELTEQEIALSEQVIQQQELITQLKGDYEELAGKINEVSEAEAAGVDYSVYYNDSMYTIQGASQETIAQIESLGDAYAEAYEEAKESIDGQVGLFAELKAESDLTIGQMSENLQSQAEVFTQYSEDLVEASKLAKEGSDPEFSGILNSIMQLGLDGAGYLHELVEAAENDSEEFNELMESWADMTDAKESLIETMADIASGYSDGMDEILGIQEEKTALQKANAEEAGEEMKIFVTENNDAIAKDFKDSINEISTEIDTQKPIVIEKVRVFSDEIVKTAETTLAISDGKSDRFVTVGKSIPEGIAQG
ncbi:MAG: phage tail tape measure protein, partial [Firmicutes bacterium]|nr:phage tail tape measure protein [Bacillota bacterium]